MQKIDKYWLALLRAPSMTNELYFKILNTTTPVDLFQKEQQALYGKELVKYSPDWQRVEGDLEWIENNQAITIYDERYPSLLKQIPDPPPILFIRGHIGLLSHPQIAVIGTRNPSEIGKKTAESFAQKLSECGFSIISGLGLGIDSAAHQGALNGSGFTIAVAGTGLDRVYPAKNKDLATDILRNGAIISEFPPGTGAEGKNFPKRNRIISGLSLGVLVVEAGKSSSSLITAKLAVEQNKEVFAIPGSIHNPLAKGCNALIKDGAKLVDTIDDILEELNYNA